MNEHSIFLAALEIEDASKRADYLDQVCDNDPSLRKQVDSLFAAHERSDAFLDVPVLKQMAGDSGDPNIVGETSIEASASEAEIDLSFLEASTVPGSLGRLRHYEVREVIGRGGCGIVLKAFDEKLERIVAIKVMAPELAATSPARKRFLREARATAAIRHENVVSIHAVEEQPLPFLVMEYIDGETLQQRLDRTGPLDVPTVLRIGQQVASGLAAAHDKGLIHRDIKPSNILLEDGTDHLKITDFGLARSADDASMTQSGMIAGTPLYMSPEQAQALDIDHRSDLFSLGSVLYVMCSGRPPFRAATSIAVLKRVVEEQPRPIQGIIPEVPGWLVAIITKLQAKNAEDRFASAHEVGTLLARCLSEHEQHGQVELPEDVLTMLSHPTNDIREDEQNEHRTPALATANCSAPSRGHNWATAAAIVLVLLAGFGVTEATGVTNVGSTVIRLFSPEGTLVVEVDDPGVSVTIDGEEMVITGAGAKEIRLKPGQYKLLASKNGKVVRQELVTVTRNGRQVVQVSMESDTLPALPDTKAQSAEFAAPSANEKAEKVRQELRRRNPDFKGAITYLVEGGRVVRWSIIDGTLSDLTPLLALDHLKELNYAAFDPERDAPVVRRLTSLEELNGNSAPAYRLGYPANKPPPGVRDEWLETVSKLPVKSRVPVVIEKLQEQNPNFDGKYWFGEEDIFLKFDSRAITDISPLKALPELRQLVCYAQFPSSSWLSDLSPLAGANLQLFDCGRTQVADLSPLKGMPLTHLNIATTPVEDLAPLADAKLQHLTCNHTKIADLARLKGMPLGELICFQTPISDLAPLKGAPLRVLNCSNTRVSDLSPLEGTPLAELYCSTTPISDLSPLEGTSLTHLTCCNLRVSDLSPLKGIRLTHLDFGGARRVSDLSPLKGMPLTFLKCPLTAVSDLSPLKGMPLESLWVPDLSAENLQIARGIESLETINGKPAAEFWNQIDAQ